MNEEKSLNKSSINWFPGHMVKAKREIEDSIKLVDIVIEIVDARIPAASRNLDFDKILKNKPRVIALNKSDMADSSVNNMWINYFNKKETKAVLINSVDGNGIKKLVEAVFSECQDKLDKSADKGRVGRSVKAMVVGIPNAGKSSFINKVSKKTSALVGNKPGVTRTKQWIRTDFGIELMDTPGILWPKFEDEKIGLHLAYTGAIKYEILDNAELVLKLVEELKEDYKTEIETRYKLDDISNMTPLEVFEEIGRKRGCMAKGGDIDYDRVANIIIDEFRKGIIGKISLEKPKMEE